MSLIQNIKLSVDAVVFGYTSSEGLSILLIKRTLEPYRGQWALPGGLVKDEESLEAAVERELKEETGVAINYLEQLYSFGQPERDPRNRVVSVAYYGLVKPSVFQLTTSNEASEIAWFSVKDVPSLAFDHLEIVRVAIRRLRSKMQYDWRYRHKVDKITTILFSYDYQYGDPQAQDDIEDVAWFAVADLPTMIERYEISEEHTTLFNHLINEYHIVGNI